MRTLTAPIPLAALVVALALAGCAWGGDPASEPELFALGNGDCSVVDGRIECVSCNPGWSGDRCDRCTDPRRCGSRPQRVDRGTVTRYFPPGRSNPTWQSGVFAGAVGQREVVDLEPVDNAYERDEDRRRGFDNRYGVHRRVERPLAGDDGALQDDGSRLWVRGYRSRTALSLGAVLSGLRLPEGAELWFYSERALHGPVTARDVERGFHGTPPLWGEVVFLELRQPPGPGPAPQIDELTLVHEYGGSSGPVECEVDPACFPGAEDQSNGVAAILLHGGFGSFQCSGSLLNSTGPLPVFLTAEHCLWEDPGEYFDYVLDPDHEPVGQADFSSSTFVFHYRNRTCDPPQQDDENDIWNALSFTGADVVLHGHETDLGLLELDQTPDPECVSYLGFDATTPGSMPSYTAGISHPEGLLAQIHVDWDPPTVVDYQDEDPDVEDAYEEDDTFYRQVLGAGDYGWPRGGSSGSPVFDPTGRVVSQLSGHWPASGATCSSGVGWMSGRLSRSNSILTEFAGVLGASQLDAAGATATSAVPLYEGELAPCVNNAYWYTINPRVADGFDVDFELGGPGGGDASIVETSPDGRGVRVLFGGSGNPVPHVNLRITVTNPCYAEQRTVRIDPTFCI